MSESIDSCNKKSSSRFAQLSQFLLDNGSTTEFMKNDPREEINADKYNLSVDILASDLLVCTHLFEW